MPFSDKDAELIGQAVSQAVQQSLGTSMADLAAKLSEQMASQLSSGLRSGVVRSEDIGGGEAAEEDTISSAGIRRLNEKRTYDEYQQESLESIKRNRSYVDKVLSDAQGHTDERSNIATQALQNAVETANLVGKQAVRHGDIAADREWNLDEVAGLARSVLSDEAFKDAIKTTVVDVLREKDKSE